MLNTIFMPALLIVLFIIGEQTDLRGEGNAIIHQSIFKIFTDLKNYLYLLPTAVLVLNKCLKQYAV